MMRLGLLILIAGLLVVPACASAKKEEPPEVKLPEESDLPPMPTYELSRTDWDTSAQCTIYAIFGQENNRHSRGLVGAMQQGVIANGYSLVTKPGPGYATLEKLGGVDRVVRPIRVTFQQTALSGNRVAMDADLFVEVWPPDEIRAKRLFQIRARDIAGGDSYSDYGPLYAKLVENLFSLDAFRDALNVQPTP